MLLARRRLQTRISAPVKEECRFDDDNDNDNDAVDKEKVNGYISTPVKGRGQNATPPHSYGEFTCVVKSFPDLAETLYTIVRTRAFTVCRDPDVTDMQSHTK